MAARPRKTKAAKALPESLVPTKRPDVEAFALNYQRLAVHLGFEVNQFEGCGMDQLVALYTAFASICAQGFLHPLETFHDLFDLEQRGMLPDYMKQHQATCPHKSTPPIR